MWIVPPTMNRRCFSACSARNACAGPSPSRSTAAIFSASVAPMKEKFSGSTASFAPRAAASANRRPASTRFARTSRVLDIWTAATCMLRLLPVSLSSIRRDRSGGRRRQLGADLTLAELLRREALYGWLLPGAAHAIRHAAEALERLLEEPREYQQRRRDGGPTEQAYRRQQVARLGRDDGLLVVVVVAQARATDDADLGHRPRELQVVRVRVAVDHDEVTFDIVECEPLVEHIAKVERQTSGQSAQAQEADH